MLTCGVKFSMEASVRIHLGMGIHPSQNGIVQMGAEIKTRNVFVKHYAPNYKLVPTK